MIQDANHHLSSEHLKFLNRGPTYVLPCQMHLLSTSNLSLNQILIKQIIPLRGQLTKLFTKYPVDLSRRHIFQRDMEQQFVKSFSMPIPSVLEQRVFYEKQMIQSIQYQLKKDQLILRRTADENNTYYLGYLNDFNTMAKDYIENGNYFETIGIINGSNSEQQQLTEIIKSIDLDLDQLERKRLIPMDYLTKLQIGKKTNINLPYLYFLPETYQDGHISLQPRLSSCKNSPIQTLATFLDQLLRPLYENFSQSTTFLHGTDFIQKLQQYCIQVNCLTPKTSFITFKIHHLYTRVSHVDILTALNRFLVHQLNNGRHQRLTLDTIETLTALVLRNNIFTYNGKIYRYIRGSPLNLALTGLLGDIYLQDWQLPLLRQIRTGDGFYGRYHDIGIFTWNGPTDPLYICLNELNEQHPDIQLTISIGSKVHFLNAYIENQKGGSLYTRVYHDPMIQPFLLPYTTDHPRLVHRQWFRFALVRAGQYCSSFEDFQEERVQIELTFLANGYSFDFIKYHIQQFLNRFNPYHQPIELNRLTYTSLRSQLFRYSIQQKFELNEQQQLIKKHHIIQLYYLFDWGSRVEFNQKFHQLWSTIVNQDPLFKKHGLKIILNSKHCYLSNTLLTQYKTNL